MLLAFVVTRTPPTYAAANPGSSLEQQESRRRPTAVIWLPASTSHWPRSTT